MWRDKDTRVGLVPKLGAAGYFWVVCVGSAGGLRGGVLRLFFWVLMRRMRVSWDWVRSSRVFWDWVRSSRVFWDWFRSSSVFWDL